MKSNGIAYLLWLVSGFGALGLHRFYMGKVPTGILWMITGGLGGIGCVYDFFTIPRQIAAANAAAGYISDDSYTAASRQQSAQQRESAEQTILRIAKRNNGLVTPSDVALAGSISLEKAKEELEKLVNSGFAELRIRENGSIIYAFNDFMNPSDNNFEI